MAHEEVTAQTIRAMEITKRPPMIAALIKEGETGDKAWFTAATAFRDLKIDVLAKGGKWETFCKDHTRFTPQHVNRMIATVSHPAPEKARAESKAKERDRSRDRRAKAKHHEPERTVDRSTIVKSAADRAEEMANAKAAAVAVVPVDLPVAITAGMLLEKMKAWAADERNLFFDRLCKEFPADLKRLHPKPLQESKPVGGGKDRSVAALMGKTPETVA